MIPKIARTGITRRVTLLVIAVVLEMLVKINARVMPIAGGTRPVSAHLVITQIG